MRSKCKSALNGMLETVPHAVGVNNHQGSRATSDPALMAGADAGAALARTFLHRQPDDGGDGGLRRGGTRGRACGSRKVFLDDKQERGAILAQLDLAVKDAMRDGSAIAIGHPHPATIAALAEGIPRVEARGVRLVFASDVVK